MQIWTKKFPHVTLVFLVFLWAGSLAAQERGAFLGNLPETAPGPPSESIEPYGVPVAPPIYLVNFLFLYMADPELAAFMPAYRAALPQEVYECLFYNPDGCPFADMQQFFDEQAFEVGGGRNRNSFLPGSCQAAPNMQRLAPGKYRQPDQINQPLGSRRAEQIARLLGVDDDLILTDEEYQCLIGTPPRSPDREIIFRCTIDLTNSLGNTEIPLSSYGLSLDEEGNIRSLCAPSAPCLEFNKLFAGRLELIAAECGFADKLAGLVAETQLLQLIDDGNQCQVDWEPPCIFESTCAGNGGSASSCQDSFFPN